VTGSEQPAVSTGFRLLHLLASTLTVVTVLAALGGGALYARVVEPRYVRSLAPRLLDTKHRSCALQVAALSSPDLLVVYGSSELERTNPFHASELFRTYPTGFTIFPIGRGGTTTLIMLQQLAAASSAVRDKRVVISVSPSWFYMRPEADDYGYEANFSLLDGYALLFSSALRFDVKQGAAVRMLQYPGSVRADPFLTFALAQVADGRPASRTLYYAVWPIGRLSELILRIWDHDITLWHIWKHARGLSPRVPRIEAHLDWEGLRADAKRRQAQRGLEPPDRVKYRFSVRNLKRSAEWTDLELLLQGLQDLGARPLLLSLPIAGVFYDEEAISPAARHELYYDRLHQLAHRYGVPIVNFEEQDEVGGFLDGIGAHLSETGWVEYSRVLDRFYHGGFD
jgi:D-alanine transfer protein